MLCASDTFVQHYIHGSSQGQFIVETYIVIFLRILACIFYVPVAVVIILCAIAITFNLSILLTGIAPC